MSNPTTKQRVATVLSLIAQAQQKFDWKKQQRVNQTIPETAWAIWLILAGRGWGKTRTGAETIRHLVHEGNFRRVALVGRTSLEARQIMVEGTSGLLQVLPPWQKPFYAPSLRNLLFANRATAKLYSSEEPNQLRGAEHDLAWCDELASWQNVEQTWHNLMLTLRVSENPQVIVTTTPKPNPILAYLLKQKPPEVVITRGSTYENHANLSPRFIQRLQEVYGHGSLAQQEIYAQFSSQQEESLWTQDVIEVSRIKTLPSLRKIIVAIDPAVTSNNDCDETGIVVVGLDKYEHAHVLDDLSGKLTPSQWADRVLQACQKWRPQLVVCETNQGGDLLRQNLNLLPLTVRYKGVRVSHSKFLRTQPIAQLYYRKLVHHVGVFPKLEQQMTSWSEGASSPDRVDALTLGLAELFTRKPVQPINLRII